MHALFALGFSHFFLQALCWTLIHSLWEGMVAGVACAIIITFTKRSTARLRYNLLIAVLSLFVLSVAITGYQQFRSENKMEPATAYHADERNDLTSFSDTSEVFVPEKSRTQYVTDLVIPYLDAHADTIVLFWFLFFLFKCVQLLAGLQHLHRLRHRNTKEVSDWWRTRLDQLAQASGIPGSILFLQSELVKVPAVIGCLKPMLLVPVGLFSNLPVEQVEAILLHELAHIRRKDFLINLLQSFIETFFFFNPAIIWISSLIREEREACCDDMVIAGSLEKENYLHALISFQELHMASTGAMALTGRKNYLLNRVKRMLTQENKKLNLMEKTVLLLGILGITAFGFITKEPKKGPALITAKKAMAPVATIPLPSAPTLTWQHSAVPKKKVVRSSHQNLADTLPRTKPSAETTYPNILSSTVNNDHTVVSQIEATDNSGNKYRIKRIDGKITELVANGRTIPEEQYSEYDQVIREIDQTQRQTNIKRKEAIKGKQEEMAQKRKAIFEKKAAMNKEAQKDRMEKMQMKSDSLSLTNWKRAEVRKLLFEKKMELKKEDYQKNKEAFLQKEKLHMEGRKGDDLSRIISDLNSENLVPDKDNLSFSLDNNALTVNGTKLPAEVFQRYREKYIRHANDRYNYSKQGHSTSVTIVRE